MARTRTTRITTNPTPSLRDFLLSQDPAWLVDELLRIAEMDAVLAARLRVAAGGDRSGQVDLSGLRRDLAEAIQPDWFVDHHVVGGYAHGIDKSSTTCTG